MCRPWLCGKAVGGVKLPPWLFLKTEQQLNIKDCPPSLNPPSLKEDWDKIQKEAGVKLLCLLVSPITVQVLKQHANKSPMSIMLSWRGLASPTSHLQPKKMKKLNDAANDISTCVMAYLGHLHMCDGIPGTSPHV